MLNDFTCRNTKQVRNESQKDTKRPFDFPSPPALLLHGYSAFLLLLLLFNQVIRMYTCTGILRTKNNTSWRIAHIFPCSPMFPNVCRYRDYGEWESYPSCTQDHNNTTVKWHVSPSIIHSSKRNKPIRKSFKRK